MKKYFAILFLTRIFTFDAQVVFCPPGAEWHYEFTKSYLEEGETENVTVKYSRDTVIGVNTAKVLVHERFFEFGNHHVEAEVTLIRQSGDTIWFRNRYSDHSWQILYNFNVKPGDTWSDTLSYPAEVVLESSVVATSYTAVNGFQLKEILICNEYTEPTGMYSITERLGSHRFLFYYRGTGSRPGYFLRSLCYSDSTIGLLQYSNLPCNYANPVGLVDAETPVKLFNVYPNPFAGRVELEFGDNKKYDVAVLNQLGRRVVSKLEIKQYHTLDLGDLPVGIYTLLVSCNNSFVTAEKLVKE